MAECKSSCGLFIIKTDKPVPLTGIHYKVIVESFASRITIEQTYKNFEDTDLECVYGFPINDQASIVGFTVKIEDRILTSQFKKKDQAFKEYNEALTRGDGAYLLDQSDRSDDTFVLSVGRLAPQKECIVSISYVSTLDLLTETTLSLVIPMSLSPRYDPKLKIASEKGVVNPPEKYQESVPYLATLDANITAFEGIQEVRSPSHPIAVKMEEFNKVNVSFGAAQQPVDRDIVIEIEVKNNPQHHVQVEHVRGNEYAAMYSFVPHLPDADGQNSATVKSELIFLVDCSGSMRDENKISDAKRAMQIFLQSVPEGCYFNFYRFGSTFQSLFPQSELYGSDTFTKAKGYAKETDADMGGTEILEPLKNIFSSAPRPGFSRQLFVLTDGDVTNTEQVIQLVSRNAHNTRVFSFGLGNSPSRSLVNGIAAGGNGRSEFIKQGQILEDKVGRQLKRALQPSVVNAEVVWEGIKTLQQVPIHLPPVFRGDRQLVYIFFEEEPNTNQSDIAPCVSLKVNEKVTKTIFHLPLENTLEDDVILSKLTARAIIKNLEVVGPSVIGSRQNRAKTLEPVEKVLQDEITQISLSYGVLSKYVSLLAIERRADQAKPGNMELREIPIQKAGYSHTSFGNSFGGQRLKGGPSHRMVAMACSSVSGSSPIARHISTACKSISKSKECATKNPVPRMLLRSSQEDVEEVDSIGNSIDHQKLLLTNVLDLQLWNGGWDFSDELQRLIGVSLPQIEQINEHGLSADVLATLSVIAFLNHKYLGYRNIWDAIVTKARILLSKTIQPAVQDAVLLKLQDFFNN